MHGNFYNLTPTLVELGNKESGYPEPFELPRGVSNTSYPLQYPFVKQTARRNVDVSSNCKEINFYLLI